MSAAVVALEQVVTPKDLSAVFYDEPETVTPPAIETPPAPVEEPGPAATPEASAASTETAKESESPKGTEAKGKDEGGHMAAARRLGQEVADLKREFSVIAEENRVLKAKLDGTYQDPPKETPEEAVARAEFKGREAASREVAVGLYGKDVLEKEVYGDGSTFKQLVKEEMEQAKGKSWTYLEVVNSPQPPIAAMRAIARRNFAKQYGDDPAQWVEKIRAELEPKILEKFKTQAAVPVTGAPAPTVSESRGSGGRAREKSIESMFYGEGSGEKGN